MDDDNYIEELAYLRAEVKRLRKALNKLSPGIDMLLKRRGFSIYKKEPAADLLIPAKQHLAAYYKMHHKYSFRLLLRDVIKHQKLFTFEGNIQGQVYLEHSGSGLLCCHLASLPRLFIEMT